jgi:hypothetical protein
VPTASQTLAFAVPILPGKTDAIAQAMVFELLFVRVFRLRTLCPCTLVRFVGLRGASAGRQAR